MSAWTETPTLAGEHVTLRPLARGDRDALVEALAPVDGQFTTTVASEATIDQWYDRLEAEAAAGRVMAFTVLDREGRISGTTRLMRMHEPFRRVEIGGTVYAPRVWRTGLNTEAKRLLLGHAFDMLECVCVQLRTDFLNRRSRAAIERLGARLDGVLRGHMIINNGHRRDTVVYSILEHEWPGVRRNLDAMLEAHRENRR